MKGAILRFPKFLDKCVTLSYDDAVRHDIRLVEIMNKYGLKGTFNLNSELFGNEPDGWHLMKQEAVDLYKGSGMEIAVHGARHLSLAEVPSGSAIRDVIVDRENLEELFSDIVQGMAYANGSVSEEVVEQLKMCGIKYARTTVSTHAFALPTNWLLLPATCHHNDPKLDELVDEFFAPQPQYLWARRPRLFYLWGHSYEFPRDNNWEVIERFAERVGKRDDVWYATNGEVYDYVQAFERLEFSCKCSRIKNPSAIDVYLSWFGQEILVPAGKTVEIK